MEDYVALIAKNLFLQHLANVIHVFFLDAKDVVSKIGEDEDKLLYIRLAEDV